jgi:hypothetical protein
VSIDDNSGSRLSQAGRPGSQVGRGGSLKRASGGATRTSSRDKVGIQGTGPPAVSRQSLAAFRASKKLAMLTASEGERQDAANALMPQGGG